MHGRRESRDASYMLPEMQNLPSSSEVWLEW